MSEADDNNSFRIRTENDGVIIPNEMKEEIFKPFVRFNEKEDGKGDYWNRNRLSSFRSLAELHQGTLAMGEGEENNTFCLTFADSSGYDNHFNTGTGSRNRQDE